MKLEVGRCPGASSRARTGRTIQVQGVRVCGFGIRTDTDTAASTIAYSASPQAEVGAQGAIEVAATLQVTTESRTTAGSCAATPGPAEIENTAESSLRPRRVAFESSQRPGRAKIQAIRTKI